MAEPSGTGYSQIEDPQVESGPSLPRGAGAASKPTVVLVIGMAGSGKTTLLQRINSHLHMSDTPGFILNLDPAVLQVSPSSPPTPKFSPLFAPLPPCPLTARVSSPSPTLRFQGRSPTP